MPIVKKNKVDQLKYTHGFLHPYSNLVFDGENYFILPEVVGKKVFGLREVKIKEHLGRKVILYHGNRINVNKLIMEHRYAFKEPQYTLLEA